MTSLTEFLQTASANHSEALTQARAHAETQGAMVDATTVNGVLTDFGLIGLVKSIAEEAAHPANNIMLGVYTGLLGNHPFNFIQNSLTGQRALAQLNWLIETGMPEHATALTQFRDLMLWRANVVVYPFASTTLHQVMVVRGVCPVKPVTNTSGYAVINTNDICKPHNPRLLAVNPRTSTLAAIATFPTVSAAGSYEVAIPAKYLAWVLSVEDAYSVVV